MRDLAVMLGGFARVGVSRCPIAVAAGLAIVGALVMGCAGGGAPEPRGGDGSGRDGGTSDAGRVDGGRRDGSMMMGCPPGRHMCGGGCIDDQPNETANGCRLGCGEACPEPMGAMARCSSMGRCEIGCVPPFRLEGERCVCTPRTCMDMGFECGAPDDGCGTPLDCGFCMGGSVCVMGRCDCGRDMHEANESESAAARIGTFTDEPRTSMTLSTLNLHSASDEDWLRFAVENRRSLLGDNPHVRVTLRDIPAGSDYDLGVWYVGVGSCDEAVEIMAGRADNTIGAGAVSTAAGSADDVVEFLVDCLGAFSSDENGTIWVRVHSATWADTCANYTLVIETF